MSTNVQDLVEEKDPVNYKRFNVLMACTAKRDILAYIKTLQSCSGQFFISLLDKITLKHPNATLSIDSTSNHISEIVRDKFKEFGIKLIYIFPTAQS